MRRHSFSGRPSLTILSIAGLLLASALTAGSEELDLGGIIGRVLENDTSLEIARESVTSAYHRYRLAKAPGAPQISFGTNPVYGLSLRRDYDFESFGDFDITDPDSFALRRRTTLTHSFNAGVEYSQLLPTGGNASVALGNTFNYITLPEEEDSPSYWSQSPELSLNISQPVFVGGRFIDGRLFEASTRIAEIGWEQSRENERAIKNQVLLSVSDLYVQLLSLQRSLEFTEARLELARSQLRQAEIDAEQGRVSANQVLGLQVAVNRQQEALLDIRFLKLQAERELASALGIGDLSGVDMSADFSAFQARVENALSESSGGERNNPDVRNKLLSLEQAEWQARVNGGDGTPRIGLNFAITPRYRDDRTTHENFSTFGASITDFFEGENPGVNFSVGVQVNVPVTDGGLRKARRDADASAQTLAQLDVKKARDGIEDRISLARERDRILRQRLELVRVDTTYQKNRLERVQRLAEARSATPLEVDGVKLEYTASLNTLWQTEADLFINSLQLVSLYGVPIETLFIDGGR